MAKKEYEMPDEYKQQLAKLAEFLEDRERFTKAMPDVPANMLDEFKRQLRKMDDVIEDLEKMLAEEYERHQAKMAKEAELTKMADDAWQSSIRIYIMTKHQLPHLLESFTERVLGPMPEGMREEFLDEVAVLETTKLDAILKGEEAT